MPSDFRDSLFRRDVPEDDGGGGAFPFDPNYVIWGGLPVPVSNATTHFLALGRIGTGKTVSIRLLLQSVIPRLSGSDERVIIYDSKRDMIPILESIKVPPEHPDLWILNPFDDRGVRWDLASDIRTPADAEYLAALMVPPQPNSQAPFWPNSGRSVVSATILGLIKSKKGADWTLRDLLLTLGSLDAIKAIVANSEWAAYKASPYLNDTRHIDSILSTIASEVQKFEIVGALWHQKKSKRVFSVKDFLSGRCIAVLGYDPVYNESIAPINNMILKLLCDRMLRGPEVGDPRHWVILDEFRWLGKVDCMERLLNQGRSKGVCVVLGTQSVEALKDKELYGPEKTESMLGACANNIFFRLGAESAKWAEAYFGQQRNEEEDPSVAAGPQGMTYTTAKKVQDRALFLASTFTSMETPKEGFYSCIADIPSQGAVVPVRKRFSDVVNWLTPLGDALGFMDKATERLDHTFPLWSPEERAEVMRVTAKSREAVGVGHREKEQERRGQGGEDEDDWKKEQIKRLFRVQYEPTTQDKA